MRTYFSKIIMCAGLSLMACSNDYTDFEESVSQKGTQKKVSSVVAAFYGSVYEDLDCLDSEYCDDSGTQTAVTDDGFSWSVGDKVSVSDGMLNYSYNVVTSYGDSCAFGVVSGKNNFSVDTEVSQDYYVFYPADAVSAWNDGVVSTMIYAEQDMSENTDGDMGPYMVSEAASDGGEIHFSFRHLTSVIDVDLSSLGVTASSVSVMSNSGVSIAGAFTYDTESGAITVSSSDASDYASSSQSDVVTVSNVNGASMVRLHLLPVTLTGGVTVTVKDDDGNYHTKSVTSDMGSATTDMTMSGVSGATVCKPFYKKIYFGAASSASRVNNWMSAIPGNVKFSLMSTPGAHDAATSGCSSSASQCQSETIAGLLANGVRALDLRPRYTSNSSSDIELDNLLIYHGSSSTGVLFKDAMATIVAFVQDNPSECVSLLIQKENSKFLFSLTDQSETWRASLRECFANYSAYLRGWITGNETLADMRGKVVIVSKNPYGNSSNGYWDVVYGGIVSGWPDDSESSSAYIYYSWGQGGPSVSVSDYYSTTSTSSKQTYVSNMLSAATADNTSRYYYTFISMAWSITKSPSTYAKTMNPYVTSLLSSLEGRLGYVYGDFMGSSSYGGSDVLKAVIDQNFKYVYQGRSRCETTVDGVSTGAYVVADEYADATTTYSKRR